MAGEAYVNSVTSKIILTFDFKEILLPSNKVKTLLSSSNEFMDSIHTVSIGPSKTIHHSIADSNLLQSSSNRYENTPYLLSS